MKLSAILAPLIAANVPGEVILATVRAYEEEQEALQVKSREKAQARWNKWRDGPKGQESRGKRLQTLAPVGNNSREGDARGLDNLQTKSQAGQEKEKNSLGASHRVRDFFEEFWLAYPRREGPNPRKPAKLSFDRQVAKGVDPVAIIEAARELARQHPTPTRFVPHAKTWLNEERFDNERPRQREPCAVAFVPMASPHMRLLRIRYGQEHSKHPPVVTVDGVEGCEFPTDWIEHVKAHSDDNGNPLPKAVSGNGVGSLVGPRLPHHQAL